MQQKHGTHFAIIFGVLILALWAIFPQPQKLFNPKLKFWEKTNLKPGIDMVGGTSLTYEIRTVPGTVVQSDLAQQVVTSLKKRVDPDGLLNLVWRPQGATRIEIQMPLSDYTGEAKTIRTNFGKAQEQLESTNVRPAEVIAAIETLKGDARGERLNQLAMGWDKRNELYGALRGKYDQIQAAKDKKDLDAAAQASIDYENLQKKLDDDNLTANHLQSILSKDKDQRESQLKEVKAQNAGFEKRLTAIDNFVTAFDAFQKVRGSLDDAADLKRMLKGSGVLEYHILAGGSDVDPSTVQQMRERLHERGPAPEAGDKLQWFAFDRDEDAKGSGIIEDYNSKKWALAWITPEQSMVNRPGDDANKWVLEKAYPAPDEMGGKVVGFRFDLVGARLFTKLTREENHGKLLAVMLDDRIISAATLQSTIGRQGVITRGDGYTEKELDYLINTLNAGSLPAQLASEPISERTVGPQLGAENLKEGLIACFLGLVVVGVFLCGYYYLAGFIAFIAVVMNVIIVLGVMALFNATFTLPGVAGIVLSIGAAVDANVLIFERLREEQQRGLSLKLALQHAYDRAFSAIVDSNMTTMITSMILIWLGSEEVKGFGITLLIGLVASLFTALFVTRSIFNLMIDKMGHIKKLGSLPLSFPKWDAMLRPHFNWMKFAPIALAVTVAFCLVGLVATVLQAREGRLFDIEFASGTAVQFELKEPMPADKVREALQRPELPAVSVVSIGTDDKQYEVVTPNDNAKQVRDTILSALQGKLNITAPSNFDGSDLKINEAVNTAVLPVKPGLNINGFVPPDLASYRDGAAIVLKNVSPKLTPKEIRDRIYNERQAPQAAGAANIFWTGFTVQSPNGDAATDTAVVLVEPGNFPYEKDPAKWRDNLAQVNWELIKNALTKPPTLQKVSNIQPSVAGDTQKAAMGALVLSVLVIMAYIWLRFGNLKYGTATVVAMLHDTLFVVGAIGVSHYLAQWGVGKIFMIEEGFRVNMTLVASVLTVMSFSMLDTIVVFDRIRENRGKYGHLSNRVINDSINQTLSRTLLTAGTTFVTLLGMYVLGGPAIHGFTFVLLVGILVGTYSSVVVAAPMLLWGAVREDEPVSKPAQPGQLSKAH